jgi:uncharacterized membrane protein
MDILVLILRLLHIVSGVIWVGFGTATTIVLAPLAAAMGDQGYEFLKAWLVKSRFSKIMPPASILTTLAGVILWVVRFDMESMQYRGFASAGSIVLAVGSLFGLLAFGHGIGLGAQTGRYAALVNTSKDEAAIRSATDRLVSSGKISTILTIIAVVCMASARYLP